MVPDGFLCTLPPMLIGQHSVEGMGSSSFPSHRCGTRGSEGVSAADTPMMKTRSQLQIRGLPPVPIPAPTGACPQNLLNPVI